MDANVNINFTLKLDKMNELLNALANRYKYAHIFGSRTQIQMTGYWMSVVLVLYDLSRTN